MRKTVFHEFEHRIALPEECNQHTREPWHLNLVDPCTDPETIRTPISWTRSDKLYLLGQSRCSTDPTSSTVVDMRGIGRIHGFSYAKMCSSQAILSLLMPLKTHHQRKKAVVCEAHCFSQECKRL